MRVELLYETMIQQEHLNLQLISYDYVSLRDSNTAIYESTKDDIISTAKTQVKSYRKGIDDMEKSIDNFKKKNTEKIDIFRSKINSSENDRFSINPVPIPAEPFGYGSYNQLLSMMNYSKMHDCAKNYDPFRNPFYKGDGFMGKR